MQELAPGNVTLSQEVRGGGDGCNMYGFLYKLLFYTFICMFIYFINLNLEYRGLDMTSIAEIAVPTKECEVTPREPQSLLKHVLRELQGPELF